MLCPRFKKLVCVNAVLWLSTRIKDLWHIVSDRIRQVGEDCGLFKDLGEYLMFVWWYYFSTSHFDHLCLDNPSFQRMSYRKLVNGKINWASGRRDIHTRGWIACRLYCQRIPNQTWKAESVTCLRVPMYKEDNDVSTLINLWDCQLPIF